MEHIWEERFENRQKVTFRAAFEQVFLEKKNVENRLYLHQSKVANFRLGPTGKKFNNLKVNYLNKLLPCPNLSTTSRLRI